MASEEAALAKRFRENCERALHFKVLAEGLRFRLLEGGGFRVVGMGLRGVSGFVSAGHRGSRV